MRARRAATRRRGASVGETSLRDTHLSEVTRVVLVHHDPVVVLATGVTATGRVLAVLADATVSRGHVTALLAVLVSLRRGNEGGGVSVMSLGMRRSARDASSGLAPSRRRVHRRARVNDPAPRG